MDETLQKYFKYVIIRDLYEGYRVFTNEELKHKGWSDHVDLLKRLRDARQLALRELTLAIGFDVEREFSRGNFHLNILD